MVATRRLRAWVPALLCLGLLAAVTLKEIPWSSNGVLYFRLAPALAGSDAAVHAEGAGEAGADAMLANATDSAAMAERQDKMGADTTAIADAVAALPALEPKALREIPPLAIDWCHVPKTGTSALYTLLQYKCDKVLGTGTEAEQWERLESIRQQVNQNKGGSGHSCSRGVRFFHRPIGSGQGQGHQGGPVTNVVAFVRDPVTRAASGLLHHFHDCSAAKRIDPGMTLDKICDILNAPADAEVAVDAVERIRKVVFGYASCVEACHSRMMLGHSCERHSRRAPGAAERGTNAASKLRKMAFVGITGLWEESICVFENDYPRPEAHGDPAARPYLAAAATTHFRVSKRKQCEQAVVDVIKSLPLSFVEDSIVYQQALLMHEQGLQRHPECRKEPKEAKKPHETDQNAENRTAP